jgi:hypothetical protein
LQPKEQKSSVEFENWLYSEVFKGFDRFTDDELNPLTLTLFNKLSRFCSASVLISVLISELLSFEELNDSCDLEALISAERLVDSVCNSFSTISPDAITINVDAK